MDIDKKTNTVLLGCVTSFLEEFFLQYTALILETRKHHFRHPWNLESWLCRQEICVAAVPKWRPGCLGLSSHKKEAPGSLTSSPHKVTGRHQWEPRLLACLRIHKMLYFDYPMDPDCSRPNINFLLQLLFPVPFTMFLSMTISHVHFPS